MYRAMEHCKNEVAAINVAGVQSPTLAMHFEKVAKIYG